MKNEEYTQLGKTIDKLNRPEDTDEDGRIVLCHNAALKIDDLRERLKECDDLLVAKNEEAESLKVTVRQLLAESAAFPNDDANSFKTY